MSPQEDLWWFLAITLLMLSPVVMIGLVCWDSARNKKEQR